MFRFLIVGILLFFSVQNSAQSKYQFKLDISNGDTKEFAEFYKDGPVLINFWALWCKPCRSEMKSLNILHNRYKDKGFKILGINQDTPRSEAKVKSFIAGYNLDYPIALDPNKKIFELFNGQVIPLSILFNTNGEILYQHTGYFPGDEFEIEEQVKKALEIE